MNSVSWTIYVVGPCRVNNELLASLLEAENGAKCVARKTIDDVVNLHDQETDKLKLVLLDSFAKDPNEYLKANAAQYSSAKRAVKIMRSLRGQTPMRITDVPYIRNKHRDDDIPADAFQRESVGSMSNCIACHTTAENGIYDDDHVVIPR